MKGGKGEGTWPWVGAQSWPPRARLQSINQTRPVAVNDVFDPSASSTLPRAPKRLEGHPGPNS